jgi:hypothetical protein
MTNAELDNKIGEAMSQIKADNVVGSIKKAYRNYQEDLREMAREKREKGEKLAHAIERLSDIYPCEVYCYILFDSEGDGRSVVIEHNQYFQGNDGPTACVPLSPSVTYNDIKREIEETLSQAIDIED